MKEIKRVWKLLVNRLGVWRNYGVAGWEQEGNTVHVVIRRFGLFKDFVGAEFMCDIDIDPAELLQPR